MAKPERARPAAPAKRAPRAAKKKASVVVARDESTVLADEPASSPRAGASEAAVQTAVPAAEPPTAPAESSAAPERPVYRVAELAKLVQGAFDGAFPLAIDVEGEISGAKLAPSGHVYFALKDPEQDACLDVVAYRSSVTPKARALVKDGQAVRIRGRLTFYGPRGRTQFVCDRIEPTGRGALLEALLRLREKLEAEGLFDPRHKRPLPPSPRIVGVVTSKTGAVIQDIRKVAFRRGGAHILLAPAVVQGAAAPEEICRALAKLQTVRGVDVIIVGRGGGSADDLAAFNDEAVVRAVAACPVPVVSAVGHEVDVTLVDHAADLRAATPSQAAEMVVPDLAARARELAERSLRLQRGLQSKLARAQLSLQRAERRLGEPRVLLGRAQQRVDELEARLTTSLRQTVRRGLATLRRHDKALHARHPRVVLLGYRNQMQSLSARMQHALASQAASARAQLGAEVGKLDAMSPLSVLSRGYCIATTGDGRALRDAEGLEVGDAVRLRLQRGRVVASVTHTEPEGESSP